MKSSRVLSHCSVRATAWKILFATTFVLLVTTVWLMAQGPEKPFQSAGGHSEVTAIRVPFVASPKDKNGKVIQAQPSKNIVSRPRGMTREGLAARSLADAGKVTPTTKTASKLSVGVAMNSLQLNSSGPKSSGALSSNSSNGNSAGSALTSGAKSAPTNFPGIGDTGFIPPDGGVAAGPYNVVAVVNSTIQVYDKNGNLLSSQALSDFYSGLPGSGDGIFDPSVAYDNDIGRFWVFATSAHDSTGGGDSNRSTHLLAVSNGSDITSGGWSIFWLDATVNGGGGCDYPHFGFDAQAIYLSCNMFSFPFYSSSSSFMFAKVRILTKSQFTNGPCCSWWDFYDLREGFLNLSKSFTVRPAIMHFSNTGDGDFWVNAEGGGGGGSSLKIRHLTNAQNCCNGIGPNLADADDGVGSFNTPPGAKQPGTSTTIDTGDTRVLFATWQAGHLSLGQTIACSQGGTNDACAAFTEVDVSGYPSFSNINDWFYSQPAGEDVYYPFVEQNGNADKMMVYSRSDATSTYAGAYYTTIPRSGTCTFCTGGEALMHGGSGIYINFDTIGRNRWGDYFGVGADPDFLGLWGEAEYATSSNTWGNEITSAYNSYTPNPVFSNNPISFGNQTVFTTSGAAVEFVTNNGNATVYLDSAFITGDSDFFISFDGCSFTTIQQGNSCLLEVKFNPHSVGPGNAVLNVNYHGNFNNFDSTLTASVTGTGVQASTSTSLVSLANPSVSGQRVTFQASVTSSTPGQPTGTVTFYHTRPFPFPPFALGTGTLSGGIATFTTSTLGVGLHGIFAAYSGDANFTNSSSGVITQTVNKDSSITTVVSSKNPSLVGTSVTFSASVVAAAPGSGTPTGTVVFKDGATTLATKALVSGKAAFATSTLGVGDHPITVSYSGDGNFVGGTSGTLTQMVRAASSTVLTSSLNPSIFGQSVTFTATITPSSATGTVTFKNGTVVLGSSSVVSGKARLSTSALSVGAHAMTAVYSGSATLLASTSASLTQNVTKASSKTTLSSSVDPSVFGQLVTFKATVTAVAPGTGTPTGTVTFKDGITILGTVTLAGGVASISKSTLTVGSHSITASYAGAVSYNASTSTLTQAVNKAATSAKVTSSKNPSSLNQAVTFTVVVTVTAPGTGTPTGSVTLKDGVTTLGTGTLSSGKATFTTSLLAHGSHSISAVYAGSANDNGATSPILTQTVN